MQIIDLVRANPEDKLLESVLGVGKDFVFSFSVFFDKTEIELQFGNINAECH